MNRRILLVDDEPRVLRAMERQLNGRFEIQTAPGPREGLDSLARAGPFGAVVSDFRMPVMSGIQFLAEVKREHADTVRVMLTGQADLSTAIAAVNQGNIFRFLTKPCPSEVLACVLEAALEQHRLITAERELLEKTLSGSIKVLTEVLSLVNPGAFRHACRIRQYAVHMANQLKLRSHWEFEIAAMLCRLGYITVPQQVLDKVASHEELSPEELAVYSAHPKVTERLLEKIPRLDAVVRIIRNQDRPPSAEELADGLFVGSDVVGVGTAILRAAIEFDRLAREKKSRHEALLHMRVAGHFSPRVLDALETAEVQSVQRQVQLLRVNELEPAMVANRDILTNNGVLLLPKGEDLTLPMIEKLRGFARSVGIVEPISVLVP